MRKAGILILFTCGLLSEMLIAQPGNKEDWHLRVSGNMGSILQHREAMGHLVRGYLYGTEVSVSKPMDGSKLWHRDNHFPEFGYGLAFYTLGNPEQLGNMYAAYWFYEIPIHKKVRPVRLLWRLSPGLAYLPKTFDAFENHKNNAVSAHLNAYINFRWYYRFELNEKLRLDLGINFAHASNGKFKVPNLGANIATINAGITFKNKKPYIEKPITDSSTKVDCKNELLLFAALGINEIEPPLGKKYLNQTYSGILFHNFGNNHKLGGGLDVYYSASVREQLKRDTIALSSAAENIQAGVKVAYSYHIGRVSFPFEVGAYLYTKYKGNGIIFNRIGVRYLFKNNISAFWTLKAHFAVAQYFEFGLGYRIPLKQKH